MVVKLKISSVNGRSFTNICHGSRVRQVLLVLLALPELPELPALPLTLSRNMWLDLPDHRVLPALLDPRATPAHLVILALLANLARKVLRD